MDKFGMSFGGGPNKKELLDTIEAQKKQLIQYQTRFKDVVRAYKSLLKEKEALEASLKVLTVSQEADLSLRGEVSAGELPGLEPRSPEDHCSIHSEDSVDTANSGDTATSITSSSTKGDLVEEDGSTGETGTGASGTSQRSEEASGSESGISSGSGEQQSVGEVDRRILQLKTQLSTLTSSLATVTQEKSRMEASFQADRKKMKQDYEELQRKLEEAAAQNEAELRSLQEQLVESKARVITQQHERGQEQSDHALMLRELQKLLQEEREMRQDAELKLEDTREALLEKMAEADRGAEYQAQLRQLSQEREEMRRNLQAAEAERSRPNPRVEELKQEMAELRLHLEGQLQQEIRKAVQAEERLREQARLEEGRVASLEDRVSELSALVGACEKARQKDQQVAQKLRERILQLDTENKTLAIAAAARAPADLALDETSLDVNVLREKMEKLKKLLVLASQKPSVLEIEKTAEAEPSEPSDGEKASALYYQQELKQLKEEFERYKARAQVVLKNKNAKEGGVARELEAAREQLADLKEKYIGLRLHCDEAEARHGHELEIQRQQAATLQQGHRQELERLEAQHRERFLRLEDELHRHRDRTASLLAEKELELEQLRAGALRQGRAKARPVGVEEGANPDQGDVIAQALKLVGPNEPTLLLYAEELARRELEVGTLRKQKHQLEADVHQLQARLVSQEEGHQDEVSVLQAQLEKLARDQSREGANLEYLKNIMYRFLTLADAHGRRQTLTAILTILHFSPQEKQVVVKLQEQSWWSPAMR
ncbi:GRIP and coiled-coil domain-containing protein 1 [Paramormyrops kingsleyae]|uniref:GRIP and coiled-coil domain-containing protein 1 n=1 Tax=Paramormyrops kingsleyae TaxID=1676925 RepID=A0A3B3QYU9_9TELE|nr:GRIP and coiled-coil domain-containing protein 1 [Paramormyrops kingsleyae]XP_023664762.1 GRIP and coiled-coil domain-containing protein 1 [Paramormyrops kingsleyae]